MTGKEREALKLLAMGEEEKALEIYRSLIKEDPDDPDIFNEYGDILLEIGRNKEALEAFEKALELYRESEMWENALAVARKMLRMKEDPKLKLQLAEIYSNLGRPDDTMKVLEELVPLVEKEISYEEMEHCLRKVASGIAADSEIWPRFQRLFNRLLEIVEIIGEETLREGD
jgi:tetratricopeptide (TPR) repeat protein